tara:strand:- start:1234 stop:1815 length:582 start_codon:yes stop_codon:yes gene_type:complete
MQSDETKIELKERMDSALKETLVQAQSYSAPQALCNQNPEKWMYLASQLAQGRSRTDLFKKENISHITTRRVEAELAASPHVADLKQELSVQKIQNLQVSHEIRSKLNEELLNRTSEAKDIDLLDLGKLIKELAVADKVDLGDLLRMRGDTAQKIEVTHKTVDFETMLKAAQEARDKDLKSAEVIEVEEDNSV